MKTTTIREIKTVPAKFCGLIISPKTRKRFELWTVKAAVHGLTLDSTMTATTLASLGITPTPVSN